MLGHLRSRWPLIFGLFVLLVGVFIAERFGLYYSIPHFDKVVHVCGGLAVAWMAFTLIQDHIVSMSTLKQLLVIVSVACFVGVLWEFAEYAANFTQHSYPWFYHWYHGGDLADTLGDLAADIVGGAVFALWALRKEHAS